MTKKQASIIEKIKLERRMRFVNRFAGVPCIKPINLTEHGILTVLLFEKLCQLTNEKVDPKILLKILRHDLLEVITGDLLYPVKNLNSETKKAWDIIEDNIVNSHDVLGDYSEDTILQELSEKQIDLFRIADSMEAYLYCLEETQMGNRNTYLIQAKNNYKDILIEYALRYEFIKLILTKMDNI